MWKKTAEEIKTLIESLPEERKDAVMPSREVFRRLLSSAFTLRKVPGIPNRLIEEEDYHCTEEEAAEAKMFLDRMFRITSKESLIEHQRMQFLGSVHYEQFMTFWKGAPLFDVNELKPESKANFEDCKQKAENFYPLVAERGFYAFDISEYIGVCRVAYACGLISEEEYNEITDRFVAKAQAFYHSFKEYALSYLCGGYYFMASECDNEGVDRFLEIQKRVISMLFEGNAPWSNYAWYKPKEREWAQIYPGNPGCFLTKAAYEQGIGYMYRDEPSPDHPDSGWRFFHGDEPEDYVNNVDNITIVSLNTICNLRPDILAYLEAPVGCAYGWNGTDWVKES